MRLLYHGPLWPGSTALQRAEALAVLPGVALIPLDTTRGQRDQSTNLYQRVRWKFGWPVDSLEENTRLLELARRERPDVIIADNSKVLSRDTLRRIREETGAMLAYYTPDDAMASHNLKHALWRSLNVWDLFFTTKTYNVAELKAAGVRTPVLVGNSFDPALHRPLTADEVGTEFEAFDLVFIGTYEPARAASLSALAAAGMKVLVHGSKAGTLGGDWGSVHTNITLRPGVYAEHYTRCLHHGKIALGFLRKINRDQITTRSIELPATARPMLAEKTDEHDSHFIDGAEYLGFVDVFDLVAKAKQLLVNPDLRRDLGINGMKRCWTSGYAKDNRAKEMMDILSAKLELHRAQEHNSGELV